MASVCRCEMKNNNGVNTLKQIQPSRNAWEFATLAAKRMNGVSRRESGNTYAVQKPGPAVNDSHVST